jgi:glutathione S-transferase
MSCYSGHRRTTGHGVLKLYNRERSGNCYKARLMLSLLGLEYEKIPVHREGKARNVLPPDFEKLSPLRQIPVLMADGKPYWGTIAILVFLARKFGGDIWLPDDAEGEAEVTQWLSLAQNEIFYGLGRSRSMRGGRWHGYGTLDEAHAIAQVALRVLERRLAEHQWLALDRTTIADVACYSYTVFAPEGGISLKPYPAVRRWMKHIEGLPGYLPTPPYDGAGGALVE